MFVAGKKMPSGKMAIKKVLKVIMAKETKKATEYSNCDDKIQPKHIQKIDGVTYVSDVFLCARFHIPHELLITTVSDLQTELESPLIHQLWIDAGLFYRLSVSPELSHFFDETSQSAMLKLLGFQELFPSYANCPHRAFDWMGCELSPCRCLGVAV